MATVREAIAVMLRPYVGVKPTNAVRAAVALSTKDILERAGVDDVLPIAVRTDSGDAVFLLLISATTAEPLDIRAVHEVLGKPIPTGAAN